MKVRLRSASCLLFFAMLLLFSSAMCVSASENVSYSVEGDSVCWVLDGSPSVSRPINFVEIRLLRDAESAHSVSFSLSELVDDQGNEFPRDLLVVETPYDSDLQTWGSIHSERMLLASEDAYADIRIGLHYKSDVRAGTYRGYLYSGQGDRIPIEITVNRYTFVAAEPQKIALDIPSPGTWITEPIHVKVGANHEDWVVSLSSAGLFLEEDTKTSFRSPLEEPQGQPLELMAVIDDEVFPLIEIRQFCGSEYVSGGVFSFKIQTETGLQHKAGHYTGLIQVDVRINDK